MPQTYLGNEAAYDPAGEQVFSSSQRADVPRLGWPPRSCSRYSVPFRETENSYPWISFPSTQLDEEASQAHNEVGKSCSFL